MRNRNTTPDGDETTPLANVDPIDLPLPDNGNRSLNIPVRGNTKNSTTRDHLSENITLRCEGFRTSAKTLSSYTGNDSDLDTRIDHSLKHTEEN